MNKREEELRRGVEGQRMAAELGERHADAAMIRNPMNWPRWPILPVVIRGQGRLTTGLLYAEEDTCRNDKPTVYLGSMFDLPRKEVKTWEEALSKFEKRQFDSFDAFFAEGWRVD